MSRRRQSVRKSCQDLQLRELLQSLQQQADAPLRPQAVSPRRPAARRIGRGTSSALGDAIRSELRAAGPVGLPPVVTNRYPFAADSAMDMTLADFGTVFGNDGIFDKFFNENLAEQVDTSGRTVDDASRRGDHVPRGCSRSSRHAEHDSRDVLRGRRPVPAVRFTVVVIGTWIGVQPVHPAGRRSRIATRLPGPAKRMPLKWPGRRPGLRRSATFESAGIRPKARRRRTRPVGPVPHDRRNVRTPPDARDGSCCESTNPYHQGRARRSNRRSAQRIRSTRTGGEFSCGCRRASRQRD